MLGSVREPIRHGRLLSPYGLFHGAADISSRFAQQTASETLSPRSTHQSNRGDRGQCRVTGCRKSMSGSGPRDVSLASQRHVGSQSSSPHAEDIAQPTRLTIADMAP